MIKQLDESGKVVGYTLYMLEYLVYSVDTKHEINISDKIFKELPEYEEVIMSLGDRLKSAGREEGIKIGIEQGIEQSERNRPRAIAKNLIAKGMTIEEIKELTDLSYLEINALQEELDD